MPRRRLALLAQLLLTIGLLALLVRDFDWAQFSAIVMRVPAWFYGGSLLMLATGQLLLVYRWHVILQAIGITIPMGRLFEQYLIALFFNNFLPTSFGGDVSKVYYLG